MKINRKALFLIVDFNSVGLENLTIEEIDRNMENYLSYQLQDFLKTYNLTVEDLRKLYMDNENVSKHNLEKFLHLSGDIAFVEATHRLARVQVENSSAQTYFYILSFDKNKTPFKIVNKISIKGLILCSFKKRHLPISGLILLLMFQELATVMNCFICSKCKFMRL